MLLCYITTHVHMGAYGMPMPQPNHAVPTLMLIGVEILRIYGTSYVYSSFPRVSLQPTAIQNPP